MKKSLNGSLLLSDWYVVDFLILWNWHLKDHRRQKSVFDFLPIRPTPENAWSGSIKSVSLGPTGKFELNPEDPAPSFNMATQNSQRAPLNQKNCLPTIDSVLAGIS